MAKIYTAHEMRVRANLENNVWGDFTTAEMLRQAADALEREEKREVKYEYAHRLPNGHICNSHYKTLDDVPTILPLDIIRRPVGEWEGLELPKVLSKEED